MEIFNVKCFLILFKEVLYDEGKLQSYVMYDNYLIFNSYYKLFN